MSSCVLPWRKGTIMQNSMVCSLMLRWMRSLRWGMGVMALVLAFMALSHGAAWSQGRAKKVLPNVFTPNGDGVNDFLILESSATLTLNVFNRAGVLVYQVQGSLIKWDGKDQLGRDLADGIYYYVLDDPKNSYKDKKGFFCISRVQMRK